MEYSKSIKHGSVVVLRGNKVILANRRTKRPFGVYNVESQIRGFTIENTVFNFTIPAGIRTYGEASVAVSK